MSNKDYYAQWLKLKEELKVAFLEDERVQEFAINFIGVKPQGSAVEMVARVYGKYCELYNKFCDCYDQMQQVQRREHIKTIIDGLTCRLIEIKGILEEVEVFEFTYPDNALQQMLITPQNIEILCPFFYPFEIREKEMQYIMDEILAGNRLGDTTSALIIHDPEKAEEEQSKSKTKHIVVESESSDSTKSAELSPEELEAKRLKDEYFANVSNIQRMERSRVVIRDKIHKAYQNENLYLELAGLKKPQPRVEVCTRAAELIQKIVRLFMDFKRKHVTERKLREKLGMTIPAIPQPSAKVRLEKVRADRRAFRRKYYEQWLEKSLHEKARVLRLKEGDIMDDVTDEVRAWLRTWFKTVQVFDEIPFAEEGGSILIVTGEMMTPAEYVEWRVTEIKRLKVEADNPKTKEQIKQEKQAEKAERKRLADEAKDREKKRLLDYKKQRLNPDNDPGVYYQIGTCLEPFKESWNKYEGQWKEIDKPDACLDAIRGYLQSVISEKANYEVLLEVRQRTDEAMRLELQLLKTALKNDYTKLQLVMPITQKRKKPKKQKPPKKEKITPEIMFQQLADAGVIRKYPHATLNDFWGDRNYAAADCRAILWTPTFPPACIGDVMEQVKIRCLLPLGAECNQLERSVLIIGPKNAGKKTLVNAIATETNALLIDLSPFTIFDKFPGPKNTKTMFTYINKISRLMQPTIIYVENADKLFYKKTPNEEKMFNPTRLSKDFFKQIVKPITKSDKILVLGTATEPWLSKTKLLLKAFTSTIVIPRTDYGSISFILTKILMKYHGVARDFNVHSLAQSLRGSNIGAIKSAIENLLKGKRCAELNFKPLEPKEILVKVMEEEGLEVPDYAELLNDWYLNNSPWGQKYLDYMLMLDCQYKLKLKAEKKK